MAYAVFVILSAITLFLVFCCLKFWKELQTLQRRYAGIIDVKAEIAAHQKTLEQSRQVQQDFERENQQKRAELIQEIEQAQTKYSKLTAEISLLEENLEDISFGLYKPHFSFQTSEEYKIALEKLRDSERQLIRDGQAARCRTQWTVGNSARDGQRMSKQYTSYYYAPSMGNVTRPLLM
jgi:Skp family chaperone for outer membrane proteins